MQVANKMEALIMVAEHIVTFDSKERNDYIEWCDSEGLDPSDINGKMQLGHIYALALVGLGWKFATK